MRLTTMVSNDQKSGDPKAYEGQPWSAWTAFLGIETPRSITVGAGRGSPLKRTSNYVLLKAEDMGVYGRYPGAEPFLLARCKYCGDKFKIAAISEHIVLRHSDGKKVNLSETRPKHELKSEKLFKSSKSKHKRDVPTLSHSPIKNKIPKLHSEELKKAVLISEVKDNCSDKIFIHPAAVPSLSSNKQVSLILKNDSSLKNKIDQPKMKRVKSEKEERTVSMEKNSLKSVGGKVIQTVSPVLSNVLLPSSKNKERKTEIKKIKLIPSQSFKPCDINNKLPDSESTAKEEMKTAVSQPIDGVIELSDIRKHSVKEEKKKNVFLKDRIYNPDRHCGVVIGKENAKPCTRSLTCKTHSISLRRAVRGRSKNFDVLLANHRAERETIKQKILVDGQNNKKEINSALTLTSTKIPFAPTPSNNVLETDQVMSIAHPTSQVINLAKAEDGFPPRLSLPVSIKNPSLLSAIKSNEFVKPDIIPLKKPKLNGLKMNWDITSDIVNNLSKRVYQAPFSTKNVLKQAVTKRTTKNKSKSSCIKKQVFEYTQWNPWYRKVGGLLSTSNNIININAYHRAIASRNYFNKEKVIYESNGFPKYNPSNPRPRFVNLKNNALSVKDFRDVYFKLIPGTKCTQSSKIITEHFGLWFPASCLLNSTKTFGAQFLIQKKIEKLNLPKKIFRVDDSDKSSSCSDESDHYYHDDLIEEGIQFPVKPKSS